MFCLQDGDYDDAKVTKALRLLAPYQSSDSLTTAKVINDRKILSQSKHGAISRFGYLAEQLLSLIVSYGDDKQIQHNIESCEV